MVQDRTILLGFYLGLGDFLSAAPVIKQLADQGNRVIVAVGGANLELAKLINFGESQHRIEFVQYSLISSGGISSGVNLFRKLSQLQPDLIVVSPHAEQRVASRKLPLLLWLLRRLYWHRGELIGSSDEPFSNLFDKRVEIDRRLKLVSREWSLQMQAGLIDQGVKSDLSLLKHLSLNQGEKTGPQIVIHPGASRENKKWSASYWRELVTLLEPIVKITFIGTPSDLNPLKAELASLKNVTLMSGSLTEAIRVLAQSTVCLTMDSGFSHIAAFLGVRHLALFGSTDPDLYGPTHKASEIIYSPKLDCQPCHLHLCPLKEVQGVPCMESIRPEEVAGRLTEMLQELPVVIGESHKENGLIV